MKKERELIQLARAGRNVEQIAARLQTTQDVVLMIAKRLGISLKPKT